MFTCNINFDTLMLFSDSKVHISEGNENGPILCFTL